jgi:hypothetical protein
MRVGVDGEFFACRSVTHLAERFTNFFWPLICYNPTRFESNVGMKLATGARE